LLGDPAGRRDLLWFGVNACGGWVLAVAPIGLMIYGLLCVLGGNRGHPVVAPPPAFPGSEPPVLIALGLAVIALGLWAAPWLLRCYGMLARSMLGPTGRAELALRVDHLAKTRRRVAGGGTVMDPEVIAQLLDRNSADGALATISPREREVLSLMAEGRSNAAIAQRLVITERAVAKHTASIFLKLNLQPSDDDNRRVLAVLAYLGR
jgi:DNA-binding CsgD family transcriptional regulator